MDSLIIDQEFKNTIPPLAPEELTSLEESILSEGVRDAIVTWNGYIIDGHNRYAIITKHGITDYRIIKKNFADKEEAIIWIKKNQLARRNIPEYLRGEYLIDIAEWNQLKEQAREKQLSQLKNQDVVFTKSEKRAEPINNTKTLAKQLNIGVEKASRIIQIKEKAPEEIKERLRKDEISVNEAYKKVKEIDREKHLEEQRKPMELPCKKPVVYHQNAIDFLNSIDDNSIDLLLTDPPYSTDVDDIYSFVNEWLLLALSKVKDTGRAYIFTGPYPKEIHAYLSILLNQSLMKLETPLVWTYRNTIGPTPTHSYKNNWQNIFYLTGFNADKLDAPNLIEQFSVQDISAPDGRHGTRYHSWEKPELIAERFIRHSTKQDQKIIDPFSGTGTFLIVGSKLQRDVAGSENNIEMLNICTERGCEICEKT